MLDCPECRPGTVIWLHDPAMWCDDPRCACDGAKVPDRAEKYSAVSDALEKRREYLESMIAFIDTQIAVREDGKPAITTRMHGGGMGTMTYHYPKWVEQYSATRLAMESELQVVKDRIVLEKHKSAPK